MYGQAVQLSANDEKIGPPQWPRSALKSFGVRYVAVDGEVEGGRHFLLGDKKVSLLDLGPIAASDLSVKSVTYAETYNGKEVLLARRAGEAVIHDRAAADLLSVLVPVNGANFEYGPDQFIVSAPYPWRVDSSVRCAQGCSTSTAKRTADA